MEIRRTHDKLYLAENRYDDPKESFKFITSRALISISRQSNLTICDFGCAAGEFLYYLKKELPNAKLCGVDILPELIEKASRKLPEVQFKVGSVLNSNCVEENSLDISFLIGVHSIFDNFEMPLSNLINFTNFGGKIYLFGLFNNFPIDVNVKYNLSEDYGNNFSESGWNIFSQESVSKFLNKCEKVKSFTFERFEMPFDLHPQVDPLRSWTVQFIDKQRQLINGLSIIQPFYLLEISL